MTYLPTRKQTLEGIVFLLLGLFVFSSAIPKAWRTLNTDFPNYYLTARLAHEGVDAARAYDWQWIEREKDHRSLDQRVVGLVPITPFSTLLTYPLTSFDALTAKRIWIIFNLALLLFAISLLAKVSGLTYFEAGILCELSQPLQINFLYGQYYVLLLFLLLAACWAAQQRKSTLAGTIVGLAAAIKIFPILLALHFLRRRNWRALAACILTITATLCISLAVFGLPMHRTYLQQVLPWTLRGDGLPAFNLHSGSYSTVLHRLFLYEPQWNPHPALRAPWLFALLLPLLQLLLLTPIILRTSPDDAQTETIRMEWSALLLIALVISTSPGSYLFMLLVFPVAVLSAHFLRTRRYTQLTATFILFFIAGLPWQPTILDGWGTLLGIPRLYALLALTTIALFTLKPTNATTPSAFNRWWLAGLTAMTCLSIVSGLRHQRGQSADFAERLPLDDKILIAAHPAYLGNNVAFIALGWEGYRATTIAPLSAAQLPTPTNPQLDQMSLTVSNNRIWTEDVLEHSVITTPSQPATDNAESPVFSADGSTLAFLRLLNGRRQLFTQSNHQPATQRTTAPTNVHSATFLPDHTLILAAAIGSPNLALYHLDAQNRLTPLNIGEARDPSVSPDGHWLLYSSFVNANWNLLLRNLETNATTRITNAPCNQVEAAWNADSRTIVYATDCGRSLWFTALAQRQILP